MRELLRSVDNLISKLKKFIDYIQCWLVRHNSQNLPEEVQSDQPVDKKIVAEKKKLEQQEIRAKQQKRDLEDSQARIKFLQAQLNTLTPKGGNHKGELD